MCMVHTHTHSPAVSKNNAKQKRTLAAFDVAQHPTRDEDVVAVVACDRSIFTEPILCFVFVVVLLNTGSLFAHSLRRALGADRAFFNVLAGACLGDHRTPPQTG